MSSATVSPPQANQQYWCHQCKKHITLRDPEEIICPDCQSEFIEEIEDEPQQQNENQDDAEDENERLISEIPFFQQLFNQSRTGSGRRSTGSPNAQARVNVLNSLLNLSSQSFFNNPINANANGTEVVENLLSLLATPGMVIGGTPGTGLFGLNPANTFVGNPNDYFNGNGGDWNAFLNRMFHETSKNGPPPAAKSEIEKLKKDKADQAMVDQKVDCAVCKDEFNWGDNYIELPCEHKYHPDCIMPWLEQHNSCPVCRFELKTDDSSYEEYKKEKEERERIERERQEREREREERKQRLGRESNNNNNNNNNNNSNNNNSNNNANNSDINNNSNNFNNNSNNNNNNNSNNNSNNNNNNNSNNRTTTTTTTTTTSPNTQRNLIDSNNNENSDSHSNNNDDIMDLSD